MFKYFECLFTRSYCKLSFKSFYAYSSAEELAYLCLSILALVLVLAFIFTRKRRFFISNGLYVQDEKGRKLTPSVRKTSSGFNVSLPRAMDFNQDKFKYFIETLVGEKLKEPEESFSKWTKKRVLKFERASYSQVLGSRDFANEIILGVNEEGVEQLTARDQASFFLTGVSGCGKTTLAMSIINDAKSKFDVVIIDGKHLRDLGSFKTDSKISVIDFFECDNDAFKSLIVDLNNRLKKALLEHKRDNVFVVIDEASLVLTGGKTDDEAEKRALLKKFLKIAIRSYAAAGFRSLIISQSMRNDEIGLGNAEANLGNIIGRCDPKYARYLGDESLARLEKYTFRLESAQASCNIRALDKKK